MTATHLTSGSSSSRSMHSAVRILTMSPTWFLCRRRWRIGTGSTAVHGRRRARPARFSTAAARRPVRRRRLESTLERQTAAGPRSFQLHTTSTTNTLTTTILNIHEDFMQHSRGNEASFNISFQMNRVNFLKVTLNKLKNYKKLR